MDTLLMVGLLIASAVFSGSETAFFALTEAERSHLRTGGPAARGAVALTDRANDLLSAILLGNLVVNVAIGAVATRLCVQWFGGSGLMVAVPAATVLLLVVGEITPKLVALRGRRRLVLLLQAPLRAWVTLTRPLVRAITGLVERMLSRLPLDRSGNRPLRTDELQLACDLAAGDGVLTETEGNFLARLLQLEELEVQHVMTPRPDVCTLAREWDRARILTEIAAVGFNRFPVTDGEASMPVGFFHIKDLLTNEESYPLQGELRPLLYAPESKNVAGLLSEMRAGAAHLAAVVDEHGDFAGVVTLADCLQALIGKVGDPGTGGPGAIGVGPGSWVVDGGLDLRQFHEETGLSLPRSRDYVTVAGFVMARLGRIPTVGDSVAVSEATLTVLAMSGHRVETLGVDRPAISPEVTP